MMPTFILLLSTFTDFKFRKVQNWIVLSLFVVVLGHHIWTGSREVWMESLMGMGIAFILCLPLYLMKGLGGGDLKIFTVFGFATNTNAVIYTFLFSLAWGSLLGIVRVILSKQGKTFIENFKKILLMQKPDPQTVQKIPYTVALLLGWFSFVIYTQHGAWL
jgi:Flp pilus assembly protein protease CpaA